MYGPGGKGEMYPKDLAALIKADPRWKGQPIILGACSTGRDRKGSPPRSGGAPGFAQALATLLGVPVFAPTENVWFSSTGMHGSGEFFPPGPLDVGGPWTLKFPGGN